MGVAPCIKVNVVGPMVNGSIASLNVEDVVLLIPMSVTPSAGVVEITAGAAHPYLGRTAGARRPRALRCRPTQRRAVGGSSLEAERPLAA